MTASIARRDVVLRDDLLVRQVAVADARVDLHQLLEAGATRRSPGATRPVSLPSVNLSAASHWLTRRIDRRR